jgi:uncharacterized cupin superfamily protein
MQRVDIDELDSRKGPASVRRPVSRGLGAENVAVNYFELDPTETFGYGYHRHPEQEEVFYIIDGTATFETEDGEVRVESGGAIKFEPGEWQLGRNDGSERLRALAMGAPAETNQTELQRHCEACGERQPTWVERASDEDAVLTICETCGAETGRFR